MNDQEKALILSGITGVFSAFAEGESLTHDSALEGLTAGKARKLAGAG